MNKSPLLQKLIKRLDLRSSIGAVCLLFVLNGFTLETKAQETITLGKVLNKKKGNSNTTITEGEGIGAKFDAGKKSLKLTEVYINLYETHPDTIKFYLRIFPLKGKELGKNLATEKVYTYAVGNDEIKLDIRDMGVIVKGDFVLGFEWADTPNEKHRTLTMPSGILKKGIYYKEVGEKWKKIPLLGLGLVVKGEVL